MQFNLPKKALLCFGVAALGLAAPSCTDLEVEALDSEILINEEGEAVPAPGVEREGVAVEVGAVLAAQRSCGRQGVSLRLRRSCTQCQTSRRRRSRRHLRTAGTRQREGVAADAQGVGNAEGSTSVNSICSTRP